MAKSAKLHVSQDKNKLLTWPVRYWHGGWFQKIVTILVIAVILLTSVMYSIAQWYIHSESSKPLQQGVSFIPDYATSLGVDPEQTMDALIGIGVKQFRLVSYWSDAEQTKGTYDFSQLDWQFKKAEAANAKVTLTLGLRQPRWPECHMPDWASKESPGQWGPQLNAYMTAVVNRYKDSPALQDYQLENEYFLKGFGICTDFSRSRLVNEYNMVKGLDPKHPIIVGRSNNAQGFPVGKPLPDKFSISVYKRVWDGNFSHRYLEYPFPAWFYGYIAGVQKIFLHRDMVLGELQAEAWPPNSKSVTVTSLDEQNKSLNAKRLKDRFAYGRATGMRQIDLWGAEYWYYRLVVLHDSSLWNVAREEFAKE
ncbi:MAG: hypothetical protein AAB436_04685 [Patescibacteria group bacterium]